MTRAGQLRTHEERAERLGQLAYHDGASIRDAWRHARSPDDARAWRRGWFTAWQQHAAALDQLDQLDEGETA